MHNRASFWKPFERERVKYSQQLLKSKNKVLLSYFFCILRQIELEKVISNGI